jgi:hypothetical protein
MKTSNLFAACTLALAALAATAQEATQLTVPPSTLTRAEVKAEFARARAAGEIAIGEAGEWRLARPSAVDLPATAARSREAVRAEARAALRHPSFDPAYIGG